jgi:putative ABC transport system substrate-binding protein
MPYHFLFTYIAPEQREQLAEPLEISAAARRGLEAEGWREGGGLVFDNRSRVPDVGTAVSDTSAAQLLAGKPDAILVMGVQHILAVAKATQAVPVAFAALDDPIGRGLSTGFERPSRNLTGYVSLPVDFGEACFALLRELVPNIQRATMLFGAAEPGDDALFGWFIEGARAAGLTPAMVRAVSPAEIAAATARLAQPASGVVVAGSASLVALASLVTGAMANRKVPAVYIDPAYAKTGGMVAYHADVPAMVEAAARYAGRILSGARVADLPIREPDKIRLAVNLKTAAQIGFTIPPATVTRADAVVR